MAVAYAAAEDLGQEALCDVHDGLREVLFLIRSARGQLDALDDEQSRLLASRFGELARRALGALQVDDLEGAERERGACAEFVRRHQLVVAALATGCEWQSPPFLGPGADERITPHWNDYKRDRHLDADAYEAAHVAEFVDVPGEWRAFATSCGMAALTTIIGFLKSGAARPGPVLAGAGTYHETKLVLEHAFGDRLIYADERDLPAAAERLRPSVVFADSVCNTRDALVAELPTAGDGLLVVDNTGLPCSQPYGERTIVFESLLKYQQLGLDRVNAGILVAPAEYGAHLSACREHLGTNASDVAIRALPRPRRDVLARRFRRIERNAMIIASRLDDERVAYHAGGCVSLALDDDAFVHASIAEAERRAVPLVGGSSFGFDTTRVYLTAARAARAAPFVRIAAGAEHRLAIEDVADVLRQALPRPPSRPRSRGRPRRCRGWR